MIYLLINAHGIFFFSSRRRHTRCSRDWSSDVCSSDLDYEKIECMFQGVRDYCKVIKRGFGRTNHLVNIDIRNKRMTREAGWARSEERRVGKECRSRWAPEHEKKKKHKKNVRLAHTGTQ